MRIISGKYKGRVLKGFDIDGTRPTMDRIKESLFGIIQNNIKYSNCLDLFAGSGSLGIEALSNGANMCYFVDNNKEVIKILKENTKNIDNLEIIKDDYLSALKTLSNKNIKFDVIFLDPPYKLNLINPSIKKIIEYDLLSDNGIIICEYEEEQIKCSLEKIKKMLLIDTICVKIYLVFKKKE